MWPCVFSAGLAADLDCALFCSASEEAVYTVNEHWALLIHLHQIIDLLDVCVN